MSKKDKQPIVQVWDLLGKLTAVFLQITVHTAGDGEEMLLPIVTWDLIWDARKKNIGFVQSVHDLLGDA